MDSIRKQDDDVPSLSDSVKLKAVITDIKALIEHDDANLALKAYIDTVEDQVDQQQLSLLTTADKQHIQALIERHPYFKNPCNYHIRLITIMKYLRRKGIRVDIKDMDLLVDQITSQIEGVERLEYGRYRRLR